MPKTLNDMASLKYQKVETNPRLPYVMGVKQSCLLNSLQYFNTCQNFSVDTMHNILEAVAQFEMRLIILHVIDQYTTSKKIYRRIKTFNYGYMEQNNKPPTLKLFDLQVSYSHDLSFYIVPCCFL